MNKTALKNFATNARKELIEKVKAKAFRIGITEESIKKAQFESSDAIYIDGKQLSATEKKQREKLISRIKEIGYQQVVEEVAYTWFNRFTALRFMEVNNYLPTKVRVLSSSNADSSEPDLIKEALTVDLDIDKELVYELKLNNKTEELYKYLLIKQCNSLNKVLPFMFETIDDYKEVLFPEGLLANKSFLREMTDVTAIPETDWEQVEVIGWLYQYYISDEKDRVFKAKAKFKAEEIPYATQLFTPDWIVQYMVQNSLGRYWIEAHPEHKDLKDNWEFYFEDQNRDSDLENRLSPFIYKELNVEDIKCFDPAMGSGHILVYMFDVLYGIYCKCGYIEREIPKLIIENNLFGLDIDDRAYQLACFSVVMKAMEYNKRFFRSIEKEGLRLNLASIQESNVMTDEVLAYIAGEGIGTQYDQIKAFIDHFIDAKSIGSLIKLEMYPKELLENRMECIKSQPVDDLFMVDIREKSLELLSKIIKQANIMYNKYDVLVTNPPYMGLKNMNIELATFLNTNYPDSKGDLFASFMEIDHYLKQSSFYACINQHSWMFLSSFETLRSKILNNKTIDSMLHLGPRAFEEIGGEVVQSTAFILRNVNVRGLKGIYLRLVDERTAKEKKDRTIEAIQKQTVSYRYLFDQENFSKIPASPIAYWVSKKVTDMFSENSKIGDVIEAKVGLQTGDNNKFLRFWHEIDFTKIGFGYANSVAALQSKKKWFPYNKGGTFRKWYGNIEYVVNWENDGQMIKEFRDGKGQIKSYPRNPDYYFKSSVSWSDVTLGSSSFRFFPDGFIFDSTGHSAFPNENMTAQQLLAICNNKVYESIIKVINPTFHFHVGYFNKLPAIPLDEDKIADCVNENISISRSEWNSFETSWEFLKHPLLLYKENGSIESSFEKWKECTFNWFNQVKVNEEKLNQLFIEEIGLQDEFTPFVEDKDISIRKANIECDIRSLISYAIGCSFGRYSLDEDGLIYAGGKFDSSRYRSFPVVQDNIIPLYTGLDNDIVTRFLDFVSVTYGEETLSENLNYVADIIGRKLNETSRETIRRYFLNDFYKDHVQSYSKRPIYWLFTSGKQKAFNCLIYMHRYDKSTLSRIRTDYLHELQIRMDAEKKTLLDVINGDGTTKEIANAKKELKSLDLKIEELRAYDEKLHHMADMQIEIDLDDGVAVNYAKFEGLLAPIK